jgi:hypothetical protein
MPIPLNHCATSYAISYKMQFWAFARVQVYKSAERTGYSILLLAHCQPLVIPQYVHYHPQHSIFEFHLISAAQTVFTCASYDCGLLGDVLNA